ncbi:hypothetical protein BN1723_011358 [Verticillium longisporum]|uniref:Uncharacterized protein n=1 Tax=Verticillium longisporum TaxID=100787 RepID=A0A0G4L6I0_VERLO|nr:hypothetical protein BN1723_011358 [Verticillium longisporum]
MDDFHPFAAADPREPAVDRRSVPDLVSGIFGTNETKASARVNSLGTGHHGYHALDIPTRLFATADRWPEARTGLQPGAHGTVAATDQRRIRWADIPAPSLSDQACHTSASPCAHPLAFKFETACRLISLRGHRTLRTLRISPLPSSARRHAVTLQCDLGLGFRHPSSRV